AAAHEQQRLRRRTAYECITPRLNGDSYSWSVNEIGTCNAQQFFNFLDPSANRTANHVVLLDLALQLNDSLICEIKTLCQDCGNVQKYNGILLEQLSARNAKLRGFRGPHVGGMRLI